MRDKSSLNDPIAVRDRTFQGTWSVHNVMNGRAPVKVIRKYDSIDERAQCAASGFGGQFLNGETVGSTPYLSKDKTIIFPKDSIYELKNNDDSIAKKPQNIPFKLWSQYSKLHITVNSTWGQADYEINTREAIEALASIEECKSLN